MHSGVHAALISSMLVIALDAAVLHHLLQTTCAAPYLHCNDHLMIAYLLTGSAMQWLLAGYALSTSCNTVWDIGL